MLAALWAGFVVAALLMLPFGNLVLYGIGIPIAAVILALICRRLGYFKTATVKWVAWKLDATDLVAVAVAYFGVVGLFRLAFAGFGTSNTLWFFLSFAGAMLLGVVGPTAYTVWIRHRKLATLGIGLHNLRSTIVLTLVFAVTQFGVTLLGTSLPQPVDWIPLLTMAITVGAFEAVFFRGFIQGTLEPVFGAAPALGIAALLYALYHFGYGMEPSDMLFLFGLGVVYTLAYRVTNNLLAVWPLLTPLGSFFVQLKSGDLSGQLPWLSMLGFGEVLGVMAIAIWLAIRYQHRRESPARPVVAATG